MTIQLFINWLLVNTRSYQINYSELDHSQEHQVSTFKKRTVEEILGTIYLKSVISDLQSEKTVDYVWSTNHYFQLLFPSKIVEKCSKDSEGNCKNWTLFKKEKQRNLPQLSLKMAWRVPIVPLRSIFELALEKGGGGGCAVSIWMKIYIINYSSIFSPFCGILGFFCLTPTFPYFQFIYNSAIFHS